MMGNGLAFLQAKADGQVRRGNHNAECKVKQDKFLKENETTQLPDAELVTIGNTNKSARVDQKHIYRSNIPSRYSRNMANKEEIACSVCNQLFIPTFVKKRLGISVNSHTPIKNEKHTLCFMCRTRSVLDRKLITKFGLKEFVILHEELDAGFTMLRYRTLYQVEHQREIRIKLESSSGFKALDIATYNLIEEAYESDAKRKYGVRSEEDFDF